MYIYELPFEINKELCRLLDNNDDWKELAGAYMKYSPFDVNEIEQVAKRQVTSPTNQLFLKWGQLNHRVEELCILFYRMKHIPALRCIAPLLDRRFHRLLSKQEDRDNERDSDSAYANKNKIQRMTVISTSSVPLPVMLMEQGIQLPTSSQQDTYQTSTSESNEDSPRSSEPEGKKMSEVLQHASAIPMIPYEDLREATNNWSDSNLLGKGGFGSVFKGRWKLLSVAVKKLRVNDDMNRELINEMYPNHYRYDDILPLYGYSIGGSETCLVYQLMVGGSLDQRLRCKTDHPPLTWSQRYRIAHGVARGLQYLHTLEKRGLIHGDIKPANILLDQCSMPKIGDFGLARKGPYGEDRMDMKVSKVHGTRPYLPNEYLTSGSLSTAVDVFSYGVVIMEMATALHPVDPKRPALRLSDYVHQLATQGIDFATREDRILRGTPNSNPHLCREFVAIGLHCTKEDKEQRPTMVDVFMKLDAMNVPEKTPVWQ